MFSDFIIYVDESGDHSLDSVDINYPVFVLDFCIFKKSHYVTDVVPRVQELKFRYFGHDAIVLHENEIRKQKPPFQILNDQRVRENFMGDLNETISGSEFTVIAAVISKLELNKRYRKPHNPYDIALCFCMERCYAFLNDRCQGGRITHIIVEQRGKREDDALQLAFFRIRDGENYRGWKMRDLELIFAHKRTNSTGLQLADLTARPVGRHVLAPSQPNRSYEIIARKLRRGPDGSTEGYGIKIFP